MQVLVVHDASEGRKAVDLLKANREYPWTPMAFAAAAFAISTNLWLVRPVRSSVGLAIILLGIPFFYYWRRQNPPSSRPVEIATSAVRQH